jgi:hypothetical protein
MSRECKIASQNLKMLIDLKQQNENCVKGGEDNVEIENSEKRTLESVLMEIHGSSQEYRMKSRRTWK